MPYEQATAIVLRNVPFSETSLVATLFSLEFGKIRGLAKGGRRLKGHFEGALDLLSLCRIVFVRKTSEALDLFTETKLLRRFPSTETDLPRILVGFYMAELINELTQDYQPHPQLFGLADRTLEKLPSEEKIRARMLHFELSLLNILGFLPSLEICTECGESVGWDNSVAFSEITGGVICEKCQSGNRATFRLSVPSRRIMYALSQPPDAEHGESGASEDLRRVNLTAREFYEIRGLVSHYVCTLLGKRPKLFPLFEKIGLFRWDPREAG